MLNRVLWRLLAAAALATWAISGTPARAQDETESNEEADAHGGEHDSGAHESAGPLTWKTDLALWTFVVFWLLFLVLSKFAWGPIRDGLDKREKGIAAQIAAAQQSHEDAKRLLADYETKLAAAHDEVRGILAEARRDAEHTQQEILAKARADAEAEIARGRREIETATAAALSELARASADMAVGLAGKILTAQITTADHARLIEEAVTGFPQSPPSRN
jgi:F-type H+-transporting ATPase subunit b